MLPAMGRDRDVEDNTIIEGDCIQVMARRTAASIDMVFADPPYNLQLAGELLRPENKRRVEGADKPWAHLQTFSG